MHSHHVRKKRRILHSEFHVQRVKRVQKLQVRYANPYRIYSAPRVLQMSQPTAAPSFLIKILQEVSLGKVGDVKGRQPVAKTGVSI